MVMSVMTMLPIKGENIKTDSSLASSVVVVAVVVVVVVVSDSCTTAVGSLCSGSGSGSGSGCFLVLEQLRSIGSS